MPLIFPPSLQGQTFGKPFIGFFPYKDGAIAGEPIYLPIPAGVSFTDGGKYSEIDMGVIGEALPEEGQGALSAIGGAISRNANFGNIKRLGKLKAAEFMMGDEGKASVATKMIMNPNTNTSFEGNTIRSFQFDFTLVGRTEADAMMIRSICNQFRIYIYPENTEDGSNVILDYPFQWEIIFYDSPGGGRENQWIPKTYFCYLTTMTTNFNPSALMFRVDGSPAEISLSLQFQETRSLTRKDIRERQIG